MLRFLLLILSIGSLTGPVLAQSAQVAFGVIQQDPNLPVEVTADNLNVNQVTGEAVFSDNVLIVQGEMRLSADRVLVVYNSETNGIARLLASGGVTIVSGPDAAEAEQADYSIDDATILMTGDVLVAQGPSAISGERLLIRLDAGTAEMSGRVRTILQSGDQ